MKTELLFGVMKKEKDLGIGSSDSLTTV